MTKEAQRIAIAEACGWTEIEIKLSTFACDGKTINNYGRNPATGNYRCLPLYHTNLNTMHEAEKVLIKRGGLPTYEHYLRLNEIKDGNEPWFGSIHATAAQRAEAFLKTLNLWTD